MALGVAACRELAADLPDSARSAVETACDQAGGTLEEDLTAAIDEAGGAVDEALARTVEECEVQVEELAAGADAVQEICDAIARVR